MLKINLYCTTILILAANFSYGQKVKATQPDFTAPTTIKGYQLVWNDEFNEKGKPNPAFWISENGFKRNNELQWYQEENAKCKDGVLTIMANREKFDNPNFDASSKDWRLNRKFVNYTSASINTKGIKSWKYGRFETRAKIDSTKGSWPAIWTLGNVGQWPANGEIDIMEFYIKDMKQSILANAAWLGGNLKPKWNSKVKALTYFLEKDPKWLDKFHVWRMDWDEEAIKIYIDDELINEISTAKTLNPDGTNPFQQEHYFLLNLAIGGINGGNPKDSKFPITYQVDYVRVYQKNK
ncbi:glycoside hydrolase family 16 protein [Pedobacter cryophilus]|uniref:Glycoside hydrolase family 16 protein n=1 Tax=Pedobacter cryophilus TaxID=2571271 RepID=A0A4V6WMX8_9SPHI|nr:glycoside hydrolase family 16 protein [Pedobacter cryophilus]TKB99073.1 glycoside hydrolase family 16 protein [Pedobacter cryophilus]